MLHDGTVNKRTVLAARAAAVGAIGLAAAACPPARPVRRRDRRAGLHRVRRDRRALPGPHAPGDGRQAPDTRALGRRETTTFSPPPLYANT
jgi:hypothetical protein